MSVLSEDCHMKFVSIFVLFSVAGVFAGGCSTFEDAAGVLGRNNKKDKDKKDGKGEGDGKSGRSNILLDTVPFKGGKEGYKVYRAPTMVVSKKGTILAFSEGRVNGHEDEDDMDVVLKRSTDGGRSWEKMQVLVNDGKNPCKNQSPVVLPNGRILLMYLWNPWIPNEEARKDISRKVFTMYSDDDGKTWSKPKDVTGMTQLRSWGWTGLGPVHGIVTSAGPRPGRVIFPSRHNTDDTNMVSHVVYSDDNGETWKIGGSVPRGKTTESTVVELSNGDIMLNSRNQMESENHRVVSISKDGGLSFESANVKLETQLIEPRGVQASLFFHSVNKETGKRNILFSNPEHKEIRSNGTLKLSVDDGRTWSQSVRYAPKPSPYFTGYSDIARLPNGDIAVLYERGEYDKDNKGARYDEVGFNIIPVNAFKGLTSGG